MEAKGIFDITKLPKVNIKPVMIGEDTPHKYRIPNLYAIRIGKTQIGSIAMKKEKGFLVIGYIEIYKPYRNEYFGTSVINYLLTKRKQKAIVGESLKESAKFWTKCISKFDGQRRAETYCDNCTYSFVIPKVKIDAEELETLLKVAYKIS